MYTWWYSHMTLPIRKLSAYLRVNHSSPRMIWIQLQDVTWLWQNHHVCDPIFKAFFFHVFSQRNFAKVHKSSRPTRVDHCHRCWDQRGGACFWLSRCHEGLPCLFLKTVLAISFWFDYYEVPISTGSMSIHFQEMFLPFFPIISK